MTPPRRLAAARVSAGSNPGKGGGASLRGASGTPPPTICPGMGGDGSLPLIRPCGATFPRGGRQGLYGVCGSLRGASGTPPPTGCPGMGGNGRSRRGGGTPPYGWGYGNTVGLTRAAVPGPPFPGRRTVGAGHARPAGLRRQASMVRSVGRGLDPSAGGYRGMAVGGRFRGASGTPPPTVCPGMGGDGSLSLIRPCGATFPQGGRQGLYGGSGSRPLPRQLVLGAELEGQAVVPAV